MATALPTFRDPAGSLTVEGGRAVRTINASARETTLLFLESALCRRLQHRGDLIEAILENSSSGLRLIHPSVPVPSYPWEWTTTQWQRAAHLTLTLCDEALEEGWILKDATPLNILFIRTRPILVDILSFEPYSGSASWKAYGQFVRTFLFPLIMQRLLHWPLALTLFRRDGYEPASLYAVLGWRKRLSRMAFWPVTLPVLLEGASVSGAVGASRGGEVGASPERGARGKAVTGLRRNLKDLRQRVDQAMPPHRRSTWSGYPEAANHYTSEEKLDKIAWLRDAIGDAVQEVVSARVLDVGANTGEYSVLAAEMGCEVVALERDEAAAERLFLVSRERGLPIQTIQADLARPTPATGWENRERLSLLDRLAGKVDLVMMLAVIHHMILIDQIPLPAVMRLCARLTRRWLIVEWIPAEDPMFQSLVRGREELYGSLSERDLMAACEDVFAVWRRHALGNGRVLFLLERVGSGLAAYPG